MHATKVMLAAVSFLFVVQASAGFEKVPVATAPQPVACALSGAPAAGYAEVGAPAGSKKKGAVVYVCSCMGTSSCSCMTEAKHEGPCACGTKGGPPMRQVAADSNWAKANRIALAAK
ncbi:MAG TPA: hypothetical protein VNF74_13830 [Terriglobales bacterium]|nr:hypothetical protein [Terriglobales bacterium]